MDLVGSAISGRQSRSMKILAHWKIVLALVLMFAAGAVTGSAWTHWQFKRAFEKGFTLEHFTARAMNALQKKHNLTPQQQPKIRAIVEDMAQQFKATFGKTTKESGGILVKSWRRVYSELTPEQRTIHAQMKKEFRGALKIT